MNLREELTLIKEENKRLKNLLNIHESISTKDYNIEDFIDIQKLESIFEKFSALTGYPTGFVKQDTRDVLISTGWSDICKNFHRGSESSSYICKESNTELTKNLKNTHQISIKKCQHNMVDGATPIIIDGEHLADLFSGQVLFEKPDIEHFKINAKEFGYDVDRYLKALEDVKVISEDKLKEVLEFLSSIAEVIADMGKDKKEYLKLNTLLEKKVEERVKEKESLLALFDESDHVLFKWKNDKNWSVNFVSKSVNELFGYTKEEFEEQKITYAECIYPADLPKIIIRPLA